LTGVDSKDIDGEVSVLFRTLRLAGGVAAADEDTSAARKPKTLID
jgi:hypothetical protein